MSGETVSRTDEVLNKKLEYWKNKLLDISLKNKLINFKERTSVIPLVITEEMDINNIYESIVNKNKKISLAVGSEKSNVYNVNLTEREAKNRLYNVYLTSRESLSEQSINTLYMTFGFLEYEDKETESMIKAPLILVPIKIEKRKEIEKEKLPYVIYFLEDDIQINPALRQKLIYQNNLDIGEDFENLDSLFEKIQAEVGKYNWKVTKNEIYFGIFSFQKLSMYQDLVKNKDIIIKHPIIRAISGDKYEYDIKKIIHGKELDKINMKENLFVLDADSTQKEAIIAAKNGISFVLQGPPGTGKSQTIANIIAQQLSDGKKVLFVSEKSAALEVVKKRLNETGVGHYLLELHNANIKGKKWVLEQFDRALSDNKIYEIEKNVIETLEENRKILREYGGELIEGNTELNAYEVLGILSKHSGIKFADMEINLKTDYDYYRKNIVIFEELDFYEKQIEEYNTNILRYINNKSYNEFTDIKREKLKENCELALENIEYMKRDLEIIEKSLGLYFTCVEDFKTLNKKKDLLFLKPSEKITKEFFTYEGGTEIFKEYERKVEEIKALSLYFEKKYNKELFEKDKFKEIYTNVNNASSFFLFRFVDGKYSKTEKIIKKNYKGDKKHFNYENISQDLKQYISFKKLEKELEEDKKSIKEEFKIEEVDTKEIKEILKWIEELKKENLVNSKIVESVVTNYNYKPELDKLIESVDNFMEYYNKITDFFEGLAVEKYFLRASWEKLDERFKNIEENSNEISKWVEFKNTLDKLDKDLKLIFEKATKDEKRNYKVSGLFEKLFMQEYLFKMRLDLVKKSREYLDMVHKKFVNADKEHMYYSRNSIIKQIELKKPKISLSSGSSEIGILKREIAKNRSHMPMRKLFNEIKNLAFLIKPCFMMSPLSVAKYLDPEVMDFDTVIFDEASQIMVEDSISSIYRGKQVIVVGDSKQLPPTMFFKVNEDVDLEEDLEQATSILDEIGPYLPNHLLRWHYRSKNESLINFSNYNFYNNSLVTFPNNKVNDFAIDYEFVEDGIYERGKSRYNRNEAKKVIELVKKHYEKNPKKSLGVIAFSIAQQKCIHEELEMFLFENPVYSKYINLEDSIEGFFVKNLETVQGDERDSIIISVGYGRDLEGKLSLNFGPLNKEGGEKRLNVAVTRAKENVTIISSIQPSEINEGRTKSEGLILLRKYMEYANKKESEIVKRLNFESELQKVMYEKLSSYGFKVDKNVGNSDYNIDIAVKDFVNPSVYKLALQLDGKMYLNSKVTRDRDRIHSEILESMGWKVHRIWAYDWMLNPEKEIEKILQHMDNRIKLEDMKKEVKKQSVEVKDEDLSIAIKDYPKLNYQKIESDKFYEFDFFSKIKEVVKNESPIKKKLLMDRIFEIYGIKEGVKSKRRFEEILKAHTPSTEIYIEKDTLWFEKPKYFFNLRKNKGENNRDINLITEPEIRIGILLVVDTAISISKEDIPKDVANLFNVPKLSAKFKAKCKMLIEELIEKKYLINGEKITLNKENENNQM
jgi:superfamily I DNA and/or RNA helicase